jgi:hypothetical protein
MPKVGVVYLPLALIQIMKSLVWPISCWHSAKRGHAHFLASEQKGAWLLASDQLGGVAFGTQPKMGLNFGIRSNGGVAVGTQPNWGGS